MASAVAKAPKPVASDPVIDNPSAVPASCTLARRGIRTLDEAGEFFSALAGDLMGDDVKPPRANAAMRAVEGIAKSFELKQKYGEGKDVAMIPDRPTDRNARLAMLEAQLKELRAAE